MTGFILYNTWTAVFHCISSSYFSPQGSTSVVKLSCFCGLNSLIVLVTQIIILNYIQSAFLTGTHVGKKLSSQSVNGLQNVTGGQREQSLVQ